jgi:hypothetical protein
MKKHIGLLVVLLFAIIAWAATAFVSLSGVAATGAGTALTVSDRASSVTWQTVFTGTPTAITVNLEGSIDGTHYFTLDSSTSTTSEMRHVVNKNVDYLRCNISAYTVNGSTTTCSFRVY